VPLLLIEAADVARYLTWPETITAVERAFLAADAPFGALPIHVEGGGFHVKAGAMGRYFAAKVNGNFPGNPARGLPTIRGLVLLCDATNGEPLAVMDSAELTRRRTAAATAVAARYLSREGSTRLAVIGCGVQAGATVEALATVRVLTDVALFDHDPARARALAASLGAPARAATDRVDLARADIIVTCTTSRAPVLHRADVAPGAFVAAVGADHPEKREISGDLMAAAAVVPDVLAQAAEFGDLHHALAEGAMRRADVRGELGAVIAGRVRGRANDEEIVIFDSTGMGLQDVAAAALVYEAATRP
jgi:alanine dehydrogenase